MEVMCHVPESGQMYSRILFLALDIARRAALRELNLRLPQSHSGGAGAFLFVYSWLSFPVCDR